MNSVTRRGHTELLPATFRRRLNHFTRVHLFHSARIPRWILKKKHGHVFLQDIFHHWQHTADIWLCKINLRRETQGQLLWPTLIFNRWTDNRIFQPGRNLFRDHKAGREFINENSQSVKQIQRGTAKLRVKNPICGRGKSNLVTHKWDDFFISDTKRSNLLTARESTRQSGEETMRRVIKFTVRQTQRYLKHGGSFKKHNPSPRVLASIVSSALTFCSAHCGLASLRQWKTVQKDD